MTLENAEMAISGMWQASDDGVLNPDTVNLVPGTIVPVGRTSQGLRPLESPGRFDVANLILEDMRSNIKRALYDEMLGPMDKTPMSATEVVQRVTELQRRIGSPIGRLTLELLVPIIRRVLYLLTASGRIENTPLLDGKQMKATPTSPLSRQQKAEEVNSIVEYLSIVAQTMGPQMVNVIVDSEKAAAKIAELKSIDPDILRSEADRKQITQAMQQQAAEPQQQAQQGPI
ncbi:MAG: portal protein [Verrucomicrobia bacterium]|nr:portal protein [Verrucomicrobiota bacterium]